MSRLTIYFTSDTHGYLFNTNFASTRKTPMGLLGMRFPKDGNTLVIDGGDTIQGSPLTFYLYGQGKPAFVAEAMNDREYDYVTLGNHDFNRGRAWLSGHLETLNAQCLCANVQDRKGELPIRPWTVRVMENGLRVGLFGIVTDWIRVWEKPENLTDFSLTSPLEAAREAVKALQQEGCDLLVGIYHGGLEKDVKTGKVLSDTDENLACRICEELPVDILLTGHQHVGMADMTYCGTHIVQTDCNAKNYVHLVVEDNGSIHSQLCIPPEDQTLTEAESAVRNDLEVWLDSPIGHLSRDLLPGDRMEMALHGSGIADFFNMVQAEESGADLSCAALPNEVRGFRKDVTVRDVVASYVYANTLKVLRVTGRQVREALEQCATYFHVDENGGLSISDHFLYPKEAHFNYDFFWGFDYVLDLNQPVGHRVRHMVYRGQEMRDTDSFSLVMCDYRATGAGDFPMWKEAPREKEIMTEVSELILSTLSSHEMIEVPRTHPIRCILPGQTE